jgi:hypothetical protein
MAIIPVRGLAAKGIIRDATPYELDMDAWSSGVNVRFHANVAERAPIFRDVYDPMPTAPVFCVGYQPATGYDLVMSMDTNGRLYQYGSGVLTDVSEAAHVNSSDPRATTATALGEVVYINRPDAVPRYFGVNSTNFAAMPNMDSAWTCRSLRAFGDYLIALNVTKPTTWLDPHTGTTQPGGAFPNLFKWSDLTLIGQPPGSWDYLNPNTSAGENPLEQLTTPIVDGLPMRSVFVIYSEAQIWAASQTGDSSIFAWQQLFSEGGLIAPNCVVEVDGVHYVFGPKDIYRHDGVTKQSIIDKRNKNTFFRYLNKQKAEVCFVSYVPDTDSVYFCCNSGDPSATYTKADRCNWAAVYDIPGDTWSFIDLPNVSAFTQANLDSILTYANSPATTTYATLGGSYYDQENTFVKKTVACSSALTGVLSASRLLAYDFVDKGSLPFPPAPECNPPAFMERIGLDLDQMGSDLATYKLVRRVFPQVVTYNSVPVQVSIGGAMTPFSLPVYLPAVSFDPTTQYKVDVNTGGRYLAIKFTVNTLNDFEIAGFDLDIADNGHR